MIDPTSQWRNAGAAIVREAICIITVRIVDRNYLAHTGLCCVVEGEIDFAIGLGQRFECCFNRIVVVLESFGETDEWCLAEDMSARRDTAGCEESKTSALSLTDGERRRKSMVGIVVIIIGSFRCVI